MSADSTTFSASGESESDYRPSAVDTADATSSVVTLTGLQLLIQPTLLSVVTLSGIDTIKLPLSSNSRRYFFGCHSYRPSAVVTANAASSVVTNIKCGSKSLSLECFKSEDRQSPVREDYSHGRYP